MKRLMVMGAAIEQVPGIKKAKEMGYEVAVIDYNPKAVGIGLADKFYNVSTIDPEGVFRAAQNFKADGFLTLATDLPMRAVAYASEKLGILGVSQHTALLATDKGEMIKALKEHAVESPWYYIIDTLDDLRETGKQLTYPCIMKPADNAASRGVALIHDYEGLIESYGYSKDESHSGQVIIEEYMEGPEVSVEVFLVCPVGHTVYNRVYLAVGSYGHLCVIIEFFKINIVVATHKSHHSRIWRELGHALAPEVVGQGPQQPRTHLVHIIAH